MKVILLSFTLMAITFSSSLLAGNGWSSSGGGEYIIDKNNPWFMGNESVKWCINYGGEENFSLSLVNSKIEIEKAIEDLSSQIKSVNSHEGYVPGRKGNGNRWRKCSVVKSESGNGWEDMCDADADSDYELVNLSEKFTFINNCADADLEFNLGNYQDEKIQSLISEVGSEKFLKIAGIAIRTNYSQETLRAKGFIYIAADKGKQQYKGARNLIVSSKNIWNSYELLNPEAPFLENLYTSSGRRDLQDKFKLKFKSYTMGRLRPVVAHEFGHVLGFSHNHDKNIMDEDYPANIIADGFVFKGNYLRESKIISKALIEVDGEHRIGYEWDNSRLKNDEKKIELKPTIPNIWEFLFNIPEKYKYKEGYSLFFVFDIDHFETRKHHLQVLTFDKDKFEYISLKNYKIELTYCPLPTNIETITLRRSFIANEIIGSVFDPIRKEWVSATNPEAELTTTTRLLSLDDTYFCGKIDMGGTFKERYLTFKLTNAYYPNKSSLEIFEANNSIPYALWLTDSDIFSNSNSTQNFDKPIPAFEFH